MKHIKLFLLVITTCSLIRAPYPSIKNAQIIKKIYGKSSAELSIKSILFMEDLFYQLDTFSSYKKMCACKIASTILQKEVTLRRKTAETADEHNKSLLEYHLKILEIQAEHYARSVRLLKQEMPWYTYIFEMATRAVEKAYLSIVSLYQPYHDPVAELAANLTQYSTIEQTEIFTNHLKTVSFIAAQNRTPLPFIIRFWDYPPYRHFLIEGVKHYKCEAKPQDAALLDAGADVGLDAAATVAEQAAVDAGNVAAKGATAAAEGTVAPEAVEESVMTEAGIQDPTALADLTPKDLTSDFEDMSEEMQKLFEEPTDAQVETAMDESGAELEKATDVFSSSITKTLEKYMKPNDIEKVDFEKLIKSLKAKDINAKQFETMISDSAKGLKDTAEDAQKLLKTVEEFAKGPEMYERINIALNPLIKSIHMVEKTEEMCGAVAKKIGATLNKIPGIESGMQSFTKFLDAAPEADASIGEKFGFYLKSPGQSTIRFMIKGAIKVFGFARKCTLTNIYRYLMSKPMGKMLVMMIEQSEVTTGGQVVTSWVNASDALVFASLTKQQTALTSELINFSSQVSASQITIKNAINTQFTTNIAKIASEFSVQSDSSGNQTMLGALPELFSAEQTYVTNALINTTVKEVFLTNPLSDDQMFYYAPMMFPTEKNALSNTLPDSIKNRWYNLYQNGNWQFCRVDYSQYTSSPVTSFVQYEVIPLGTSTFADGDPVIAAQTTIFGEYIPTARKKVKSVETYTISIECILLAKPINPCIMGIIYNQARWISGVKDFENQNRLFCIYTTKDQAPGTMNVGFAETFYQNQSADTINQDQLSDQGTLAGLTNTSGAPSGFNAVWPAFQILSKDIDALAQLQQKNLVNPIPNPRATIQELEVGIPYTFTIENQPSSVTLTITNKSTGKVIFPYNQNPTGEVQTAGLTEEKNKINLLNPLFFLYHNIGFMSAGCSTQFIIKEPRELTYNNEQIAAITTALTGGQS